LSNLATNIVDTTNQGPNTHADLHDNADAEINAIEAELGTVPKGPYTDVKTRLDSMELSSINAQTGTSYTLVLADRSKIVGLTNAAAITLTVPPNSTAAFPVGTTINLRQGGAGQVTVAAGAGVTINSRGAALKLAGQYAYGTLVKTGTDTWDLFGDITA
jgi:hypothetical protein